MVKERLRIIGINLQRCLSLIEKTIKSTKDDIEKVAKDLYLSPSLHILATGMQGVAREGALKVREVVLNHTEGYEGTEFKHGPNTTSALILSLFRLNKSIKHKVL
jgi:glucosamine 6-phosphate synthetase-like amidotransferase/phosphosugar isomerase protein